MRRRARGKRARTRYGCVRRFWESPAPAPCSRSQARLGNAGPRSSASQPSAGRACRPSAGKLRFPTGVPKRSLATRGGRSSPLVSKLGLGTGVAKLRFAAFCQPGSGVLLTPARDAAALGPLAVGVLLGEPLPAGAELGGVVRQP